MAWRVLLRPFMTCLKLAMLAVLGSSACMVGDDTPDEIIIAGGARPPSLDERSDVPANRQERPDPDFCTLLPADGPCSLACDPEALGEQFVPLGTCAAFACTLTDNRQFVVHACHVPPS